MRNVIIIGMVISFAILTGCSGLPIIGDEDPAPVEVSEPTPSDALVDMLTTKKTDYLHTVLKGIMKNGTVVKRTIKGELVNREYPKVEETWILEDAGGNKHIVTIQNGVLTNIDEYDSEETAVVPIGGWKKE